MVTQTGTESNPIRERLLPQTSIRFFAMLIAFSAVGMYVLRAGFIHQRLWAIIGSMLIVVMLATFIVYASLFVIANVFSRSTRALFRAFLGQDSTSSFETDTRGETDLGKSSGGVSGDGDANVGDADVGDADDGGRREANADGT